MKEAIDYLIWWNHLEQQWQNAFAMLINKPTEAPGSAELDLLYHLTTIRLAGPGAPFPNLPFELTNLSGIKGLPNLEILILTNHQIETISEVATLPQLKSLFLLNNAITSLAGIEQITQLEQLYLQFNQVSSLKPVEQLINLRELYISDNCIDSLDGLTAQHSDKLTRLVCLPNLLLKQKEIIRVERELGIICRGR